MKTIVDLFFLPPMDPAHERWMASTWASEICDQNATYKMHGKTLEFELPSVKTILEFKRKMPFLSLTGSATYN
jgi:hypothetical protein